MSREIKSFEFGPFHLEPRERLLLRNGEAIQLAPKVFETLVVLVEQSGHIVEKDELMKRVWPDTFVDESSLTRNISLLRKALGEDDTGHRYIETVPKLGYRFTADVNVSGDEQSDLVVEKRTFSQTISMEEEELIPSDAPQIRQNFEQKMLDSAESIRFEHKWKSKAAALALSALPIGIIVLLYFLISYRVEQRVKVASIRSMAVLPFKPLNASEQSENYIGVGIADALITRLGSIVEIGVRPTSAVLRFDNPKQDSLVAARSLGVEAVLEGSYQLDGGRLRVTVQLVSASDGTQVWSNTFEDRFTNILAVQDRISKEVAQSLVSNLSEAEQRLLAKRPTANAEAYQSYLKGRYFWNKRTVEGLERSIEYFNKAIEIDPKFALAHVGLAESFDLLVFYNDLPPNEFFPKAKAAALNALEIDPALGEAHLPLARVRAYYEWDRAGAESAFQQAIRLNPNDATSHQWYGEYLGLLGKLDLAIEELKLAQELDPLSLAINMDFGTAFYYARQYDRAIDQYRKTLEIEPNFGVCRVFLAGAYAAKGMYEESIREHRKAIVLAGDRPILWALLGHTLAVSGQKAEAQSVLDKLQKQTERHYVAPITLALIHAGLGDKTQALDWLDKACQERDPWLLQYIGDPLYFDKLRSDSRFTSLLQRISLAQ